MTVHGNAEPGREETRALLFPAAAAPWHESPLPATPSAELAASWRKALGDEDPDVVSRRLEWVMPPRPRNSGSCSTPGEPCAWLASLDALRAAIRSAADRPLMELEHDEGGAGASGQQRLFADLWQPVAERALDELRRALEPLLGYPVSEDAWTQLGESLLHRLCQVGAPTLWDGFNRERGPGATLLAYAGAGAHGAGPPARQLYERFIRRHREDGLESLLDEFPVLGRLLGTVVVLWKEASAELLSRLNADRAALAREDTWGISRACPLRTIRQGLSDAHRGGRAVAILTFGEGESEVTLVYKPKDMEVDAAYQAALCDLNRSSALTPLRTLKVLTRPGYGYMEHVPRRFCPDGEALERFYFNAGRLTAVLYVLGCTDCHYENLIASGDQLVLVDTETLLEPVVHDHVKAASASGDGEDSGSLENAYTDSVLRSGLLPVWTFYGSDKVAEDISALGVAPPKERFQSRTGWLRVNTDHLVIGQVQVPSELPTSLPVDVGEPNPLDRHVGSLLEGFKQQARTVIERRSAWLSEDGPLTRFKGLSRRLLLRATHVYATLQQELLQPPALVSSAAQGLVLEQLARTFLLADSRPRHWPVFAAEVVQLEQLDIPFFVHPIDGAVLPVFPGMDSIDEYMKSSGLEACRRRLRELDEGAIGFQCRLMEGALQARVVGTHAEHSSSSSVRAPEAHESTPLDSGSCLARAEQLARALHERAITTRGGDVDWLGLDLGSDAEKIAFGPVGLALYGGSAGVALLQAALAAAGGGAGCETPGILGPLAALAASGDLRMLRRWWRIYPLGTLGTGGVLLTLLELDRLGAAPPQGWRSHRDLALALLTGLSESRFETDAAFDVLSGVTGLIGPLLGLADPRATALAIHAGNHLLGRQLADGGWAQSSAAAVRSELRPLTGFSHGTAGMASALAALHRRTREPLFLAGAARAMAYERACFDAQRRNWPYYRSSNTDPLFMATWCHGAPGIALSRLCLRETPLADAVLTRELEVALDTTAETRLSQDHLCCGTMGLVTILRLASQRLGEPHWLEAADRLETEAIARARRNGHFRAFGTRDGSLVMPGSMTGLSGIGLALLHSAPADACLAHLLTAGLW